MQESIHNHIDCLKRSLHFNLLWSSLFLCLGYLSQKELFHLQVYISVWFPFFFPVLLCQLPRLLCFPCILINLLKDVCPFWFPEKGFKKWPFKSIAFIFILFRAPQVCFLANIYTSIEQSAMFVERRQIFYILSINTSACELKRKKKLPECSQFVFEFESLCNGRSSWRFLFSASGAAYRPFNKPVHTPFPHWADLFHSFFFLV